MSDVATLAADACRVDVWLWRARFFKTRALACRFVDAGRVRLTRHGAETRLDKPSRTVRPGDRLTFALDGRLTVLAIAALGDRRGPASEARRLYLALTPDPALQAVAPDNAGQMRTEKPSPGSVQTTP